MYQNSGSSESGKPQPRPFCCRKRKLKAPINGVVLEVAAKSGSYVQPGIPLITVGDPDLYR